MQKKSQFPHEVDKTMGYPMISMDKATYFGSKDLTLPGRCVVGEASI